jgi:hypothetical protein
VDALVVQSALFLDIELTLHEAVAINNGAWTYPDMAFVFS